MDNKAIAGILYETADLLEIDGGDSFRIRSYRNAAEAIEAQTQQIADLISEPKKVLAIAGIGKGMLVNMQEMFKYGSFPAWGKSRSRSCSKLSKTIAASPAAFSSTPPNRRPKRSSSIFGVIQ